MAEGLLQECPLGCPAVPSAMPCCATVHACTLFVHAWCSLRPRWQEWAAHARLRHHTHCVSSYPPCTCACGAAVCLSLSRSFYMCHSIICHDGSRTSTPQIQLAPSSPCRPASGVWGGQGQGGGGACAAGTGAYGRLRLRGAGGGMAGWRGMQCRRRRTAAETRLWKGKDNVWSMHALSLIHCLPLLISRPLHHSCLPIKLAMLSPVPTPCQPLPAPRPCRICSSPSQTCLRACPWTAS